MHPLPTAESLGELCTSPLRVWSSASLGWMLPLLQACQLGQLGGCSLTSQPSGGGGWRGGSGCQKRAELVFSALQRVYEQIWGWFGQQCGAQ